MSYYFISCPIVFSLRNMIDLLVCLLLIIAWKGGGSHFVLSFVHRNVPLHLTLLEETIIIVSLADGWPLYYCLLPHSSWWVAFIVWAFHPSGGWGVEDWGEEVKLRRQKLPPGWDSKVSWKCSHPSNPQKIHRNTSVPYFFSLLYGESFKFLKPYNYTC